MTNVFIYTQRKSSKFTTFLTNTSSHLKQFTSCIQLCAQARHNSLVTFFSTTKYVTIVGMESSARISVAIQRFE